MPNGTNFTALLLFVVVGIPLGVLWAVAAVDVLKRAEWEFPSFPWGPNTRTVWSFVVLFLAGVGALVYWVQVMRPYPRRRR